MEGDVVPVFEGVDEVYESDVKGVGEVAEGVYGCSLEADVEV